MSHIALLHDRSATPGHDPAGRARGPAAFARRHGPLACYALAYGGRGSIRFGGVP